MPADQLDGRKLLTVNGTLVMSHGYVVLLNELADLRRNGVSHFRLSPQAIDMVRIATLHRAVLDGAVDADEAVEALHAIAGSVPFVNGYLHGREGLAWIAAG